MTVIDYLFYTAFCLSPAAAVVGAMLYGHWLDRKEARRKRELSEALNGKEDRHASR